MKVARGMRHPRGPCALLCATALLLVAGPAAANPFEEMFGAGPRVKAMGSAGTALADDHAATYYNPANLTRCSGNALALGYDFVDYHLEVTDDDEHPEPEELRQVHAMTLGTCSQLPAGLSLGILFWQGLFSPSFLDQTTIDATPRFVLYGQRLEAMSVMAALGYQVFDSLSLGVGTSILANSIMRVANEVPILTNDREARNTYLWEMARAAALHAGVRFNPFGSLQLGAAYRSTLYHKLEVDAPTQVEFAGVPVEVALFLESVTWYTPHQLAIGASYQIAGWTFAGDLTWYNWSAYPGPFIHVTAEADSAAAALLDLPPTEPVDFHDVVQPRVGVEYQHDLGWALRAGYSYRVSPVPSPSGRANLLDGDTHLLSAGAGLRWDFGGAAAEPPPDQAALEGDAEAPGPASAPSSQPGSMPAVPPAAPEPTEAAAAQGPPPGGVRIGGDIGATLGLMPEREVQKSEPQPVLDDYRFGGLFYNIAATFYVEY